MDAICSFLFFSPHLETLTYPLSAAGDMRWIVYGRKTVGQSVSRSYVVNVNCIHTATNGHTESKCIRKYT